MCSWSLLIAVTLALCNLESTTKNVVWYGVYIRKCIFDVNACWRIYIEVITCKVEGCTTLKRSMKTINENHIKNTDMVWVDGSYNLTQKLLSATWFELKVSCSTRRHLFPHTQAMTSVCDSLQPPLELEVTRIFSILEEKRGTAQSEGILIFQHGLQTTHRVPSWRQNGGPRQETSPQLTNHMTSADWEVWN